eukprot:SAG11_NODE_21568_length_422_cov_10.507740_1_plen_32_part_10
MALIPTPSERRAQTKGLWPPDTMSDGPASGLG